MKGRNFYSNYIEDVNRDWLQELRDNGHIVQLHGNDDFITHSGLLYVVHRLFFSVDIQTECIFIDRDKRIAEYKATITVSEPISWHPEDNKTEQIRPASSAGVYTGHGDACPKTSRGPVLNCYKRVAETRAVNRALRFIVGGVVGLCSVEEIDIEKPAVKPRVESDYQNALERLIAFATHVDGNEGFTRLSDYINNVFNAHPSRKHLPNLLAYTAEQLNTLTDWLTENKSGITTRFEEYLGRPTQQEVDEENRANGLRI